MTYAQIIEALRTRKCDSTADALERAVRDEATALHAIPSTRWGKLSVAREDAKTFYAEDITDQLNDPKHPTPSNMLSLRRFPVAWAVAEVLRTNDDVTKNGTEKV